MVPSNCAQDVDWLVAPPYCTEKNIFFTLWAQICQNLCLCFLVLCLDPSTWHDGHNKMYHTPKCGLHSTRLTDVRFTVTYTQDKRKSNEQLTNKISTLTWNAREDAVKKQCSSLKSVVRRVWTNHSSTTWRKNTYSMPMAKDKVCFFTDLDSCVIVSACGFVISCFIWKFMFCSSLPSFVWFPVLFSLCSPVSY